MADKGFGTAMIFDGDGSSQGGHTRVNAGPTFASPEWTELFQHAVKEADRCGLALCLMIQSGWNLGGPNITPEYAAKRVVFSTATFAPDTEKPDETRNVKLPQPPTKLGYYRDIAVLAFPNKQQEAANQLKLNITPSSAQPDFPVSKILDGNANTFWVSRGTKSGEGPTAEKPEYLTIDFEKEADVDKLLISPRAGYGPKEVEFFADGQSLAKNTLPPDKASAVSFTKVRAKNFKLVIKSSYDPTYTASPRNVQITGLDFYNGDECLTSSRKNRSPLQFFNIKIATHEFGGSAPDCRPLYEDEPSQSGDPDFRIDDVIDLTNKMSSDGTLNVKSNDFPLAPKYGSVSSWTILRIGYTPTDARVSTSSGQWQGLVLDHLRTEAFDFYWNANVKPLLESVKPHCGKTLRYLETDSWEAGGLNWTETFREEFKTRRGYDPLTFLPIVAGFIANDRNFSNRFLNDFRRTIGDLIADNHYRRFKERSAEYGLGIMPESGGPHGAPIDSLQLLGMSDIPMSEFWSWSPRHRIGDKNRFFIKQPASAAHTNGHRLVAAEGETNIGMYWQESFANNLKPSFDQAVCEGLNLLVWHTVTASPKEAGLPGQLYFAGTYFNPQCIVWQKSKPFLQYVNRVDYMMQQGLPVADVLEYYGEGVPNFTQGKWANTAKSLPDYDHDVATEDVLLNQIVGVKKNRIVLKDGMSYQVLVLPERKSISLRALKKIKELVEQGATVIGNKPERTTGLNFDANADVEKIANSFWNKVISGKTASEVLKEKHVMPDFKRESGTNQTPRLEWIHRRIYKNQVSQLTLRNAKDFSPLDVKTIPADIESGVDTDIYFVANLSGEPDKAKCVFRVGGRIPELWDAVSGTISTPNYFHQYGDGTTKVTLDLAPFESVFVVFRKPFEPGEKVLDDVQRDEKTIEGTWTVKFYPNWLTKDTVLPEKADLGEPLIVKTDKLESWSKNENPLIKYYSGLAVYSIKHDIRDIVKKKPQRVYLKFDKVCEFADVKINGKYCGSVWAAPYKLDITDAVLESKNGLLELEIEVVNRWVNRLVGDASKPENERVTRTNIKSINANTELMESGIIGDVQLLINR
jgi:hypothetical protein